MKTYYVGSIPFNGDNSLQHYDRKGMKLGKNIFTDALDSASSAVSGAANKVSKFATNTYNSARKGATNAYNSGKEFLTGSKAKQRVQNANQSGSGRIGWTNDSVNKARKENAHLLKKKNDYQEEFKKGISPYDTKAQQRRSRDLDDYNRVKRDIKINNQFLTSSERQRNSAATHRALQVAQAQREYSKTLPGKVESFSKAAEKTVNESYQEVVEWLDKNKKKAKKAANSAASTISKSANTALSTVKATASSTAKKVGNFFERLFG